MLETVLRQKLTASSRFEIVDIPPDTIKEIASGPTISNCNDWQRRFAQMVGANWAAWGTVQKVSNLILLVPERTLVSKNIFPSGYLRPVRMIVLSLMVKRLPEGRG